MPDEIQPLIAALSTSDPNRRRDAAQQLAHLKAREAAVPLVRACADEDEDVREWVVSALEHLGPPLAKDVDALAALVGDQNPDVGYWAATLLGRLGGEAGPAVPALAAALAAPADPSVRQRAVWALGEIGPAAKPALDALQQVAASDDPRLARLVQEAISQIGG